MQKPTFSLDCSDAAEQIELPPTEFPEVEGYHLVAQMGEMMIVCVHSTLGAEQVAMMPVAVRECLPDDDALDDHFTRLLRAPLN